MELVNDHWVVWEYGKQCSRASCLDLFTLMFIHLSSGKSSIDIVRFTVNIITKQLRELRRLEDHELRLPDHR